MNLAMNLPAAAARHGDRTALRLGATTVGYAELEALSDKAAANLRARGVVPGDRVGIMLPNVPEFAIAYYGALRAGAIVVPMNVLLKQREVAFHLSDSGSELVLAWHECATAAVAGARQAGADCVLVEPGHFETRFSRAGADRLLVERAPDDTAVILYTSGTTGRPKGAELTHGNLALNVEVVLELFGISEHDVILGALPLFHSFGQTCGLNAAVAAGACLTLVPRFDPGVVLDIIERERVTVFEGVPTMYSALLDQARESARDASSLRVCLSGGAALPLEILHGFESAFGCVILEGYGLSETSPVACFNQDAHQRIPGSIGKPVAGVEMRVVDEQRREVAPGEAGEIAIRGHNVMKGYWRQPQSTAEALDAEGWFYTGDIGRLDTDGRFYIVDRKKDLIIRGGYNVYPRELEEILHEHPAVREAAVVGLPDAGLGEEVGAAVALHPDVGVTVEELRAFVRDQVAAYKYPRHVWIVDELPKGPTGKVLKRAIEAPEALRR